MRTDNAAACDCTFTGTGAQTVFKSCILLPGDSCSGAVGLLDVGMPCTFQRERLSNLCNVIAAIAVRSSYRSIDACSKSNADDLAKVKSKTMPHCCATLLAGC
eukprot:TRINITY_DN51268_c0_g1_i1.p1 TRINITY_DN51268_c0_g1~~TRINITY_DN51268_c0_g1_i1.p1  ORF type:complete len:103 (+),score=10.67 TRINITY_DN51268_c0_g1_i1:32-340(+)